MKCWWRARARVRPDRPAPMMATWVVMVSIFSRPGYFEIARVLLLIDVYMNVVHLI